MYRVYSGSYKNETYALQHSFELFCNGYECVGVKVGDFIRIQVGEFSSLKNAEYLLKVLEADGFTGFIEEEEI